MSTKTAIASALIPPYGGGGLINLMVVGPEREELTRQANGLQTLQLSPRSVADLELLATGAFSPLDRFMDRATYTRVLEDMRLPDGTFFPIPMTLSTDQTFSIGTTIALRDAHNELLAMMLVEDVFERDVLGEARHLSGIEKADRPLVAEIASWGRFQISGALRVVTLPKHYDFPELRRTPAELRRQLESLRNPTVLAFQTGAPLHRADEEFTKLAAGTHDAVLLLHPAVGSGTPGDLRHFAVLRSYKTLFEQHYDRCRTVLNFLPLPRRVTGPKAVLWHAIIHRNYGASHFIDASDRRLLADSPRESARIATAAQTLVDRYRGEVGVVIVPYQERLYLPEEHRWGTTEGRPVRNTLARDGSDAQPVAPLDCPPWAVRPETANILRQAFPPRHRQGFCLWFTGLPSAGKSTIAQLLTIVLMEHGRPVTLLDGDVVRTHLSKGLGFSKEDRDTNILRIGFVAAEIVRHHGIVVCAAVSPYEATRQQVRAMMPETQFILVYVDTPLNVCEQRDVKGLYGRARRGHVKGVTGIDDPYEPPPTAEIVLSGSGPSPEENARAIVEYLKKANLLREG